MYINIHTPSSTPMLMTLFTVRCLVLKKGQDMRNKLKIYNIYVRKQQQQLRNIYLKKSSGTKFNYSFLVVVDLRA